MEFWVFVGGQNLSDFRGGCPIRGWGLYVIFHRGRSIHSSCILSFWNASFQKFKSFLFAAPSFSIFRFKTDTGLQVDIDFNTESKLSFSRSSFFSCLTWHSKPTKLMKLLSFYPFGGFRGPSKPSSQWNQSIFCECKHAWQLLVKIKSDPSVNKQPSVKHEGEF